MIIRLQKCKDCITNTISTCCRGLSIYLHFLSLTWKNCERNILSISPHGHKGLKPLKRASRYCTGKGSIYNGGKKERRTRNILTGKSYERRPTSNHYLRFHPELLCIYCILMTILVLFFMNSDEEDNMDEDEEKIAVAATFGISAVFKSPNKNGSTAAAKSKLLQAANKAASSAASNPASSAATCSNKATSPSSGPSNQNVDKERLTVDISALRQQYSKLRQRQKQAHIIFTCKN